MKKHLPEKAAERPAVAVTSGMKFTLDYDWDRYENGYPHMSIADVWGEGKLPDGRKVVVAAAIGGGIFVSLANERQWFLSFQDILEAAVKADEQYLQQVTA